MRVRKYALDPTFGMLIDCPNMCGEDGRMEIMENQDTKGPYDDVLMKCTNCGAEKTHYPKAEFLSIEFTYAPNAEC